MTAPEPGGPTSPGGTAGDVAARLYAAVARGDIASVTALLHPDAVLTVPGDNPLAGRYTGPAGLAEFTAASAALVPDGVRTEVVDIMSGTRHAAVHGVSRAVRAGRVLDNPTIHLVTVDGGRVTAITVYNSDQRAVDAFWNG